MSEENKSFDFNKAVNEVKKDRNLGVGVGGFLAAFVGLFLPWYTIKFLSVSDSFTPGLSDDGLFVGLAAAVGVVALLNVLGKEKRVMYITAIVAAVISLLVVFSNWPDSDLGGTVSTSIGYWLSLVGSGAAVYGSVMKFNEVNKK